MNIWGSLFILRLNMEQNSTSLNPQWRERKQISNQQSMKVSFLALAIEIDIIKAQTVSSTSFIISPQNWHSIHIQILYEKHIQRNLVFNFSATRVSPGMVILVDLPLWSRWITMTFSEDIHGSQTSDFSDFGDHWSCMYHQHTLTFGIQFLPCKPPLLRDLTDFLLQPTSDSRWWCWPSRPSTELHLSTSKHWSDHTPQCKDFIPLYQLAGWYCHH